MYAICRYIDDRWHAVYMEQFMQYPDLKSVLGGTRAVKGDISNRIDLVDLSQRGIKKSSLLHLAEHLSLSVHQIAELLPVGERTIQRYTNSERFNQVTSEHILQIAEVVVRGKEVFDESRRLLDWLNSVCKALGDRTPLSLLNSRFGIELVLDELGRIEHGVFA